MRLAQHFAARLDEYPDIVPGGETVWVERMCGAIEVPFGDEDIGYVQWEDNFVVTEDGIEALNHMPKTIWSAGCRAIARDPGMKPLLERVLAKREILKA